MFTLGGKKGERSHLPVGAAEPTGKTQQPDVRRDRAKPQWPGTSGGLSQEFSTPRTPLRMRDPLKRFSKQPPKNETIVRKPGS